MVVSVGAGVPGTVVGGAVVGGAAGWDRTRPEWASTARGAAAGVAAGATPMSRSA
jgi:hypothetical protein